jgi:hypothetical protein
MQITHSAAATTDTLATQVAAHIEASLRQVVLGTF